MLHDYGSLCFHSSFLCHDLDQASASRSERHDARGPPPARKDESYYNDDHQVKHICAMKVEITGGLWASISSVLKRLSLSIFCKCGIMRASACQQTLRCRVLMPSDCRITDGPTVPSWVVLVHFLFWKLRRLFLTRRPSPLSEVPISVALPPGRN